MAVATDYIACPFAFPTHHFRIFVQRPDFQTVIVMARGNQALREFFSDYPGFKYRPSADSIDEWRRLCRHCGWPSRRNDYHHAEREEAWQDYRRAMTLAFNDTFGNDDCDSEAWAKLCSSAGISDIPRTLEERKSVRIKLPCPTLLLRLADYAQHARQSVRLARLCQSKG